MLVLSRNLNQSIIIGEEGEIVVTVLGIKQGQIRLGIKASSDIPIHRSEIFDKIQAERDGNK